MFSPNSLIATPCFIRLYHPCSTVNLNILQWILSIIGNIMRPLVNIFCCYLVGCEYWWVALVGFGVVVIVFDNNLFATIWNHTDISHVKRTNLRDSLIFSTDHIVEKPHHFHQSNPNSHCRPVFVLCIWGPRYHTQIFQHHRSNFLLNKFFLVLVLQDMDLTKRGEKLTTHFVIFILAVSTICITITYPRWRYAFGRVIGAFEYICVTW